MPTPVNGPGDARPGDKVYFKPDLNRDGTVTGTVVSAAPTQLTVEHQGKRYRFNYTYTKRGSGFRPTYSVEARARKLDAWDLWSEREPEARHVELRDGVLRLKAGDYTKDREAVLAELDALAAWCAEEP